MPPTRSASSRIAILGASRPSATLAAVACAALAGTGLLGCANSGTNRGYAHGNDNKPGLLAAGDPLGIALGGTESTRRVVSAQLRSAPVLSPTRSPAQQPVNPGQPVIADAQNP
jgi:hypothetical protein